MDGRYFRTNDSTKQCFRKTLGNVRVNYQELLTIFKEIENVLNNCPLTVIYYDKILQPLTPNKLLYGHNTNTEVTDNQYEDILRNISARTYKTSHLHEEIISTF